MMDYDRILSDKCKEIKPSGIRKFFDIANSMEGVISLGVGEPAPVPTPAAIRNAVCDALGFAINELPLTPEKILLEWDKHQHSL